jgi:hypothetical protein
MSRRFPRSSDRILISRKITTILTLGTIQAWDFHQ